MQNIRQVIGLQTDNGFTLVEIIAALAIIAILASLSLPQFINLDGSAKKKALHFAVSELNAQEKLLWSKIKISDGGWVDDETLFSKLNANLGPNYKWAPIASTTGGTLHYQDQKLKLSRNTSTAASPGHWIIKQ